MKSANTKHVNSNPEDDDLRHTGRKTAFPWGRMILLIAAAASMLTSVLASLVRAHIPGPWVNLPSPLPDLHGALMIFGFLGTAISLERAIAYRAGSSQHPRWAFAAPISAVMGNLSVVVLMVMPFATSPSAAISTLLRLIPGLCWALSLLLLTAVYEGVWKRQKSFAVLIQGMGALVGACSAALWACGLDSDILTPWWLMMLILTIVGERLELAHVAFIHPLAKPGLVVATAFVLVSLVCSLVAPTWGYSLLGLSTGSLLLLMLVFDTARKTFRVPGVTGFMGISMLAAYFWGLAGSLTWLFAPSGGLASTASWWDFAIHALALGFIMSMVVAHVCIIIPSVIRRSMPFHPILWLPLIAVNAGLALRFLGTVRTETVLWQAGDAVSVGGMLALVVSVITMATHSHRRPQIISVPLALRKQRISVPHTASLSRDDTVTNAHKSSSLHVQNGSDPSSHSFSRTSPARRHIVSARHDSLTLHRCRNVAVVTSIALIISTVTLAIRPDFATTSEEVSTNAALRTSNSSPSASSSMQSHSSALSENSSSATVAPTGHTTVVRLTVEGMSFTPSTISVPAGDKLEIHFVNTGNQIHDVILATGQSTGRVNPGNSAKLSIPRVTGNLEGWCSLPGHRQMGMEIHILATGLPSAPSSSPTPASQPQQTTPSAAQLQQFAQKKAAHPAALGSYTGGDRNTSTRRFTITISQGKQQITNELTREVWTFNSSQPGPVLRGKVGDRFIITVKNATQMEHSIDFHAGADAVPQQAMKAIAPGKSLLYSFTATRWGIWMYHCSSVPMSLHIANGMMGAVIIEPRDGLPAVDAQYVLVQSEQYLGGNAQSAEAAKVASMKPDIVAFNGRAFQYDAHPLTMPASGRVRIWVLNAGPNSPLSFHIVGTQFSTVWSEGRYLVRDDHDAATGSQALALLPAQGGFVELSVKKKGDYPIVNHVMSLAERGAHGILRVQ